MTMDPMDPAVHIARERLDIPAEQLVDYPRSAFDGMPNPIVRYDAYQKLLKNNRFQVQQELKRMAEKGITLAEFKHAGSPEDFPYKIIQGGSGKKVISVVTPADSRRDRVVQMQKEKIEKTKREIQLREQRATMQQQRNQERLLQEQEYQRAEDQRVKGVAYNTKAKGIERRNELSEHIQAKLNRADQQIMLQSQNLATQNMKRSQHLKKRIQSAQETAYGLSDQAKQQKQACLAELKQYAQERDEQRKIVLERNRTVAAENCRRVKEKADQSKQYREQRTQQLAQKVQEFETHHDTIVAEQRRRAEEENHCRAQSLAQVRQERIQGFKELTQAEKNLKAFQQLLRDEQISMNVEGSGSRLARKQQLVRTRNECEDEKARTMKGRIDARVAYKKKIYDEFEGNAPFIM